MHRLSHWQRRLPLLALLALTALAAIACARVDSIGLADGVWLLHLRSCALDGTPDATASIWLRRRLNAGIHAGGHNDQRTRFSHSTRAPPLHVELDLGA